jgi:hypothetical protein
VKSAIPLRDDLVVRVDPVTSESRARWPQTWANWFNALMRALVWNLSLTATKTHDFANIAAHTELSTTVTVEGARTMDTPTVIVTPSLNTAGVHYKGVVTADDTVTIYALNTTAVGIDPASTTFRVLVLQP